MQIPYLDVGVRAGLALGEMAVRKAGVVDPEEAYLQIGEVAERTGVTQRTLRFYEERGLLKPPTRMEGGFRLYSEEDVSRVERIKRLQTLLGFTLAEIKEMVEADEVKMEIKAEYRPEAELPEKQALVLRALEVTERQYAVIRQKVEALGEMQTTLEARLAKYRGWLEEIQQKMREQAGQ